MSPKFLSSLYFQDYGTSLAVGIGVPIPVLDYADRPRARNPAKLVNYTELRSGEIEINRKNIRTSSLSSYRKARVIVDMLKTLIQEGSFLLTQTVAQLPEGQEMQTFEIRTEEEARAL